MTRLDWRSHRIGPPMPCIHCGRPALCRDEHDQPAHKTCAETNLPPDPTGGSR
jgi:hypothetical protein